MLKNIQTLHKRTVDKPSFKRLISINLTHKINLQSFERLKLVVETLLLWEEAAPYRCIIAARRSQTEPDLPQKRRAKPL
jgi:hypothetical protein